MIAETHANRIAAPVRVGVSGRAGLLQVFGTAGILFAVAAFCTALPYSWDVREDWFVPVLYALGVLGFTLLTLHRPRSTVAFCAILFGVAVALRLGWIASVDIHPESDFLAYRNIALEWVLHGRLKELRLTCWPWGYPAWLSLLMWLFGTSVRVPQLANALLGGVSVVLVYALGRRLLSERAARIGACLYAFWPGVILWTSILCSEIPHQVLYLSALLCLLQGWEHLRQSPIAPRMGSREWLLLASTRWLLSGGALAALAEFFRPLSILVLGPFLLWAWAQHAGVDARRHPVQARRLAWVPTALAYTCVLGLLLTAKSEVLGRVCLAPSYTQGLNLAYGTNVEAGGAWNREDADYLCVSPDPRVVNDRGIKLGLRRLAGITHPGGWHLLTLFASKFPHVWSTEESCYYYNCDGVPEAVRDDYWLTARGDEVLALTQGCYALMLGLAAVGFWRGRRNPRLALLGGILAAFTLLHAVSEAQDRYHFPVQGFLAVAAAAAFVPSRPKLVVSRDERVDGYVQ